MDTLVNKDAETDIRCKKGNLPINIFRAVSLKFDKSVEELDERLLGGNVTNLCIKIKKKTQFFSTSIVVYSIFYLFVYMRNATNIYTKTDSNKNSYIRIKWYMSYTLIGVILITRWFLFCMSKSILHAWVPNGFDGKPKFCMLYSEQLLSFF